MVGNGDGYVLGHAPDEQARLDRQDALLRPLTARLLRDAGTDPGRRVLDVGCGTGDVTLLVAEWVGAAGQVIGVDRAEAPLAAARARAWRHVTFVQEDLATLTSDQPFDAVVGRLVLLYQPDPAATLRHLAACVRPDGVLAFLEMVMAPGRLLPERPLFSRAFQLVTAAFDRSGVDVLMGVRLPAAFHNAGLPNAHHQIDLVTIVGPDPRWLEMLAGVARSLLPAIARFGLATPAEIDIETLAERLVAEASATPTAVAGPAYVGCWARTTNASAE